ncbi:MAG: cation:proton antiporter [Deltaproteobacteria bacterium]|jgi:NhaP-type Na+/H+ or K+/H+ antiporter|nr:cation:proton antiporter [Deltaproteobacteria bacterium]MBW2536124.1 cation:proton antiporter [Deltaproteobacteria bacterium]
MMALLLDGVLLAAGAIALAQVARWLRLPPLLGMLAAGVVFGALNVDAGLGGPRLEDYSSPIRTAVLALVLLRAGLGIPLEELRRSGALGLRLAILPLLADAALVTTGGVLLLGLPLPSALVLGFLVAAISPAIVIPGLLDLLGRKDLSNRRAVSALLVGAPLDNILALVLMGVALDAALSGSGLSASFVGVLGWKVGVGLAAGVVTGAGLGRLATWRRVDGGSPATVGAVAAAALAVVLAGELWEFSFVLALIALAITFARVAPQVAAGLEPRLKQIWTVAQYALFGLIGAAVDLGPVAAAGAAVVVVVVMGQIGRAGGSWLATAGAGLSSRERLGCVLAYVPKATIQAAFAALPLDRGLAAGELILTAGVLAVVITAPMGVVSLNRGAARLLAGPRPEPVAPARDSQPSHG